MQEHISNTQARRIANAWMEPEYPKSDGYYAEFRGADDSGVAFKIKDREKRTVASICVQHDEDNTVLVQSKLTQAKV